MKLLIKKVLTMIVLMVFMLNTQYVKVSYNQITYTNILDEIELPYKW